MENKSVTIVLIAAICVSLGGTFITLNKLSSVEKGTYVTGYVTDDTGTGVIEITSNMAILINTTGIDDAIDFGDCFPDTPNSASYSLVTNKSVATQAAYGNCSPIGSTKPDYIEILNVGNKDCNLSVTSSLTSATMIGGTGEFFGYTSTNSTESNDQDTDGGCYERNDLSPAGSVQATWKEFASTSIYYPVCNNLSYNPGHYTTTRVYLKVTIPIDASVNGEQTSNLVFWATEIV